MDDFYVKLQTSLNNTENNDYIVITDLNARVSKMNVRDILLTCEEVIIDNGKHSEDFPTYNKFIDLEVTVSINEHRSHNYGRTAGSARKL